VSEEFDDLARVTIERCDELESHARDAWQAMTDLDELTGTIVEEMETAVRDMSGRMRTLVSEAAGARARTEGGTASVETALQGLLQAVTASVSAHENDAQRVVEAANTIGALPEEPAKALQDVIPRIDNGVAGIDARVESLNQLLTREGDAALASLRSSATALGEAFTRMDAGQNEWVENLDALTVSAGERIEALLGSLAAAADVHARGTVDALNRALPAHESLVARLASLLGEQTAKALEPPVATLEQRQTSLEAAEDKRTDALTTTAATIGKTAGEAAGELDDIAAGVSVLVGTGH
jgi:hypothetical protein